jgi:hypothetical protein
MLYQMKTQLRRYIAKHCTRTAVARAGLLVLIGWIHSVHAEENCGSWRSADVDPTKGKFEIELRVCDLPYGLSAYIQVRNSSEDRVALSYRLFMKDHTSKDNDIVIEANGMTRAETCQACAKRYSGLESWQVLSAKSLGKEASASVIQTTDTNPGSPDHAEAAKKTSAVPPPAPAEAAHIQSKPEEKPVVDSSPPVENVKPTLSRVVEKPSVNAVAEPAKPASAGQSKTENKAKPDGFRTEDGTIIPWDQMPPEFRPHR